MPVKEFLTIALFNKHTGTTPEKLDPLLNNYSFAQCNQGRLLIAHKPESPFSGGVKDDIQNYHASDINLFFGNLQSNVAQRINAYWTR